MKPHVWLVVLGILGWAIVVWCFFALWHVAILIKQLVGIP
jgi:hypothetical protein